MFSLMGSSPFDFVMSGNYKKLKDKNIHRTFFENDLKYFCRGFKHIYTKFDNLENLFITGTVPKTQLPKKNTTLCLNVWDGFYLFRKEMANANKGEYSRHISNPGTDSENGSACKKLNLALRWLVRKEPVDLGLWKHISPSVLYIPLDVHVARTARQLGLLERKSNDKKAVIALTEKLREFDRQDPVKYDFSLFGIGIKKTQNKDG
jgi:uncharacterized protein (TIGR02757 family)